MDLREIKNEIKREISAELELYQEKVDRNTRELELLRQISTDNLMACLELRRSQESLTQNVQELQRCQVSLTQNVQELQRSQESLTQNFQRFQDEMLAFKDEMKKFKIEINKKWGELANRLGTLAEDIFGPGIPYLLKSLGFETEAYFFDLEVGPKGRRRQYDVLIFARAEDGREKVFVAEVKNQGRSDDFNQMKSSLEALPELFPAVKGKGIVPVLAAFRFDEGVETYANKRGVLLVRMGGEYLEPLNSDVLKKYL